jgi:hypothetical protein
MSVWAQRVVEPKIIKSGNSLDPYVRELGAQLNPRMLGVAARQTHIYLGSPHNWTQGC